MCASHATKKEAALDIVEEVMDTDLLTQIMGVLFSFQCPDTHIFIKSARKWQKLKEKLTAIVYIH